MQAKLVSLSAIRVLVVVLSVINAPEAFAQNGAELSTFGGNIYTTDKPTSFNRYPPLESVVPVPASFFEAGGALSVSCLFQTLKLPNRVKGVKGDFRSELYLLDPQTGTFQSSVLAEGPFTVDSRGLLYFKPEIPAALFPEDFDPGDSLAWVHNTASFGKKKGDYAELNCSVLAE